MQVLAAVIIGRAYPAIVEPLARTESARTLKSPAAAHQGRHRLHSHGLHGEHILESERIIGSRPLGRQPSAQRTPLMFIDQPLIADVAQEVAVIVVAPCLAVASFVGANEKILWIEGPHRKCVTHRTTRRSAGENSRPLAQAEIYNLRQRWLQD